MNPDAVMLMVAAPLAIMAAAVGVYLGTKEAGEP